MERDQLIRTMEVAWFTGSGGMGLALDVVLAEVLATATDKEIGEIVEKRDRQYEYPRDFFDLMVASRRARYQRVKTAEERVTISGDRVFVDGNCVFEGSYQFRHASIPCAQSTAVERAEIFRLGQIRRLEESK